MKHIAAASAKALARRLTAGIGRVQPTNDGPRVLCYHGICENPADEWSVTPTQLKAHMEQLARARTPVPIDSIVSWALGGKELPSTAIAVTFDDGFRDVLAHAAPILAGFGVPATVFVSTGLASHGSSAADPSFVVSRPLMDWGQIRELQDAGWTVGSHCITHPRLSELDHERALAEIRDSRREISSRLGTECRYIAYPFGTPGAVSDRDRSLAADAGYRAGFLAVTGAVSRGADPFAIPRSKVLGTDTSAVVQATMLGRMDLWSHIERRH